MTVSVAALARAVAFREMRLAVIDRTLRERTGQWRLEQRIPVKEALEALAEEATFTTDDGAYWLPLHESADASLTDEYVLIDTRNESPTVSFFDIGQRAQATISLAEFERTYPAWRLRFWTATWDPPEAPSFLQAFPEATGQPPSTPSPATGAVTDADGFMEQVRSALVERRDHHRTVARKRFERTRTDQYLADNPGAQGLIPKGRSTDEFGQQEITLGFPGSHDIADEAGAVVRKATGLQVADEVIIDGDGFDALPIEAEIFDIDQRGIHLGIYWDSARNRGAEAAFTADEDVRLNIARLLPGKRFGTIESAIESVSRTDRAKERYSGSASIAFDRPEVDIDLTVDLDRFQQAALSTVTTAEDVAVVHAPPWTGVGRLYAAILAVTAERDERVLYLTPDDAGRERLLGTSASPRSLGRYAGEAGIEIASTASGSVAEDAPVVITTISEAAAIPDHCFDLAVVDQAATISVPGGAVPFAKASRVAVVGDPAQSPRSLTTRDIDLTVAPSIWEHLQASYGEPVTTRLRCQYRMNQAIAQFPNREWYDDQLIHGQQNRTWRVETLSPLVGRNIDGEPRETPTGSVFNEAEAEAVVNEVIAIIERGIDPANVGVIAGSSAQVGKIRAGLKDAAVSDAVVVGRLTDVGCSHRDVIVIATVRAPVEDTDNLSSASPLWTARGLNLAMTRAQKRLVIMADWDRLADDAVPEAWTHLATFLADRELLSKAPDHETL